MSAGPTHPLARILDGTDGLHRPSYRINPETDCWEWQGGLSPTGYGNSSPHRRFFRIFHGAIPDGYLVLHSCDNPRCVNPSHLRVGTQAENMAEMVERGRHSYGERHADAVLTESQVADIRLRYAQGRISQAALAREYGVGRRAIGHVLAGNTWKHLLRGAA